MRTNEEATGVMEHAFTEMPGHPRTCWACGSSRSSHAFPITTGNEQGPQVVLELTDLRPGIVAEGPARCERKRPPR